jgi:nickel-dependent lactate racemase
MNRCIHTVWNAWEEEDCVLPVPASWRVTDYSLPSGDALSPAAIRQILHGALAEETAASRLRAARSVCVLVDDATRPACWTETLTALLDEVEAGGVPASRVRLLITLAGHARMSDQELDWKLGAFVRSRVEVLQHDLDGDFDWIEVEGRRTGLHPAYARAGFKIALGSLIPHPFAGFSGGGKAVLPGVADAESIRQNHFLTKFGLGRVFDVNNEVRRQMDAAAAASGLDLLVNGLSNAKREIVGLHAGPPSETFRAGVEYAQWYSAMTLQRSHDLIVLNAYPRDRQLLQVKNALNVFQTLPASAAEACRAVILMARLSAGLGHHALFGPGGSLYRTPVPISYLRGRLLVFYCPAIDAAVFRQVFPGDWRLCHQWDDVVALLQSVSPQPCDVAVFHQASMQTANGAELAARA